MVLKIVDFFVFEKSGFGYNNNAIALIQKDIVSSMNRDSIPKYIISDSFHFNQLQYALANYSSSYFF